MKDMDFTSLIFIWIGFLVLVNIITAGLVIYRGRKKLPLYRSAGAVVIPLFVLLAGFSLMFCPNMGAVSDFEAGFVLSSALILMLLSYFASALIVKLFVLAAIVGSFFFLPHTAFAFAGDYWIFACIAAAAVWGWLIFSFVKLNDVDGLTISEGTFIGLAIFFESWFLAVLLADNFAAVGLIGASMAICLYAFKNWNKYPAKIPLGNPCVLPVAFISGWLLVKIGSEGAWLFAVIIPMFYLAETGYAWFKKIVLKVPNAQPFLLLQKDKGAYQNLLVTFVFKANIVLLIFATFTPKSVSGWSFFGLAVVWIIYELNKLKSFGEPEPTIRGITKGIFTEAKKGLKEQGAFYSLIGKNLKEGKSIKAALSDTNAALDSQSKKSKPAAKPATAKAKTKTKRSSSPKPKSSGKDKSKNAVKAKSKPDASL